MALLLDRQTIHDFRDQIKKLSLEDVSRCYQCGKCTAGCPVASEMDIKPNQIMRLAQINARDSVLSSSTIWLCLSCEVCSTRCPADIDIARVMDTLRKISMEEQYSSPQKSIIAFHKTFLKSVEKHGRLNELEFSIKYNLALRKPLKNLNLALKLFQKGKINPFGTDIKEKNSVKKVFKESHRFITEKK